jgi:hypothetical protein
MSKLGTTIAALFLLLLLVAALFLKAWLLLVVLGWFGVHALNIWQSLVIVFLLSWTFTSGKS